MKQPSISILILIALVVVLFRRDSVASAQADALDLDENPEVSAGLALDIWQASGKLTLLRVHEVGSGWGASPDFLDAEVVIQLDSEPDKAFGFQLRDDANLPVRQGMLELLRDAFTNNWTVGIDYDIQPGSMNGVIMRLWLSK